jgi:hypothetical protein
MATVVERWNAWQRGVAKTPDAAPEVTPVKTPLEPAEAKGH